MVRYNGRSTVRPLAVVLTVMAIGLCSGTTVPAQWEHIYGGSCIETGYGGVTPVTVAAGGGYIAVGRSSTPNVNAVIPCTAASFDTYIVRTNAAGGVIWAYTYDVSCFGGNDAAYSIVEKPGMGSLVNPGFVVVGTTDEVGGTGSTDAYLMEVDVNGGMVWMKSYGVPGGIEQGRDIVRTAFGLPTAPPFTAPGDYVVAGWSFATGTQDAMLFRTDPLGNLRWNMLYDGMMTDYLMALEEAAVNVGTAGGAGDIVGAGGTTSYGNGFQGLALRVNGNNGTIGPFPQGVGVHGGPVNESFNALDELTVPAPGTFAGDFVFAGFSSQNPPLDIYVVHTTNVICAAVAQVIIGGPAAFDNDVAYDITEILNPLMPCGVVGALALTGAAGNGSPAPEAFLMTLNSGNLLPNPVCTFTYGDRIAPGAGFGTEIGHSIEDDAGGFIICGFSTSNLNFNVPPDPEQLYLIRMDAAGVSGPPPTPGCESTWPVNPTWPTWSPTCPSIWLTPPLRADSCNPDSTALPGDVPVCPRRPCIIRLPDRRGEGTDGGRISGSDLMIDDGGALRAYPNPVRRGNDVTLEFLPKSTGGITVRVMNLLGQVVDVHASDNIGAAAVFAVKTGDLPAGTYLVEVSDGETTRTTRVVVTD